MAAARRRNPELEESLEERLDRDASGDLVDVPAAVVCALCGDADCAGCEESALSRSGIVSIIAWERPHAPTLSRLWSTARSSTRDAEAFFELLPDGPIAPALRFAATCELLASTAAFLAFVGVAAVVAPSWLHHVAFDPSARSIALRALVLGLPAFAGMLVVAHAAHGLSIDLGARRNGGARVARSRALRFGLYACGWDLVMGPIGAIVVAIKEGIRPALDLAGSLSGLPTRATKAFLRGCYRLEGERANKALGTSYVGATVATIVFAFLVLAAVIALALS
ncbi:MAG: hypothetical protein KIT84_12015 [Labilithrix sp.]|nr:hypothetical protein [Labilithrix sp.]MCW5811737.1 hypothetical protein [Labilithrix sp.]